FRVPTSAADVQGEAMRRWVVAVVAVVIVAVIVAALVWDSLRPGPKATQQYASAGSVKAIPAAAASPPDDGNWTMPAKEYAATRGSGLDEINPASVAKLAVSFTVSTGTTEGFEAPPLVVDNTMYVVTPWPNNVLALDLTKPGAPTKWV